MSFAPDRRRFCAGLAAALVAAAAGPARTEEALELKWDDLAPSDGSVSMDALRELGVVQHGQMSRIFDQESRVTLTREYDGRRVRIPGYLVPLEYDGTGVTGFLLTPYVGACVHVPPPPPNQLILVTTETPYEAAGMFEAIWVTGAFEAAAADTGLAEVGYMLTADRIEPYG